jgi:transcriptional regulator with XRE-family HTH domain
MFGTTIQHNRSPAYMTIEFGELLRRRRAELRLSLRECAVRADIDAGNLSRIERGRVAPPQDPEVLARLVEALQLPGTPQAQELMDVAAMQNGRIPRDILSNEEVMSALPVLLRTVNNKQLDGARIEKLVNLIKNA